MPATAESRATTRAFARVLGPFFSIIPSLIVIRMGQMETLLTGFFENAALSWIMGAILLFAGLVIIAHHQIWSSGPGIVISLLGWILALRGIVLLAAPEMIYRAAESMSGATGVIRIGFGLLAALGLWLTYVGWVAKVPATS